MSCCRSFWSRTGLIETEPFDSRSNEAIVGGLRTFACICSLSLRKMFICWWKFGNGFCSWAFCSGRYVEKFEFCCELNESLLQIPVLIIVFIIGLVKSYTGITLLCGSSILSSFILSLQFNKRFSFQIIGFFFCFLLIYWSSLVFSAFKSLSQLEEARHFQNQMSVMSNCLNLFG